MSNTSNLTSEQVQEQRAVIEKAVAELQTRRAVLNLLYQFQRQGVTRPDWTWFIPGNRAGFQQ
jgi:hypothetical protein